MSRKPLVATHNPGHSHQAAAACHVSASVPSPSAAVRALLYGEGSPAPNAALL